MRAVCCALLIATMTLPLICQSADTGWTLGTVMAVKKVTPQEVTPARFDITVRVLDVDYVCAYTQQAGVIDPQYAAGRDAPVRIKGDILMFRDKLGKVTELPIVSRAPAVKRKQ